jgi:diguanylate cyclase (GGDEF)-like protein
MGRRFVRPTESLRRPVGSLGFGPRLFLALIVALAVVGAVGYILISSRLYQQQIDTYASTQQADAEGFEAIAREYPPRLAIREIDELLDALGRRPGAVEAILIGPDNIVRASNIAARDDRVDSDPRINAALRSGVSYAGSEADPSRSASDFEFVTPVNFPGRRYALETSYSGAGFDAQLAGVSRVLLLVMGLGAIGVAGLFYLLGGRTLLRDHRLALQRATRDGLTDLPNHRAFEDELSQAMAAAGRSQDPLALALLDLDHFKLVNDRHGHPQGDSMLRRVAAVLREGRAADRAYRIGGDEFALLMPGTDEQGARILVRRLIRALADADVAASIGLAMMRAGHSDGEELRAEADAALYEAKRRGGSGLVSFEEIRDRVSVTTGSKREAVRHLIDEKALSIVYQPIWSLESGALLGVEALARPDPSYGLSGPAEAFDIAEQIGCVHELDELCATWALSGAADLPDGALLFVNLTPKTLELDCDEKEWLHRGVERAGLAPGRVIVEVTERIGARTVPVIRSLDRLRRHGFKLALDDVGTGNAGLEMLRKVGADFVKIDQSIVAAAPTEHNARAVLMAMATFARQTGAFVIAEGIEDEETLEFLRSVEPLDARPGTIIQGGQGFELGYPSPEMPHGKLDVARVDAIAITT